MTARLSLAVAALLVSAATVSAQDLSFRDDDVMRAKEFWIGNATGQITPHKDCLETINEAMRLLYQDRAMRLGSTVDLTMKALIRLGRAKAPRHFQFLDAEGRKTVGVTEPVTLEESVFDGLVRMSGGFRGWHLFGFSILDGNHSIVLILDLNDRDAPKVFWADQWSSKGGWKEYDKAGLDEEIRMRTQSWWKQKLASKGVKFKSDSKIYQLVPSVQAPKDHHAEVLIPRLNLRTSPSVGDNRLLDADGTQVRAERRVYPVLARQMDWVQLRLPDGRSAWANLGRGRFVRITEAARPPSPPHVGITSALGEATVEPAAPTPEAPPAVEGEVVGAHEPGQPVATSGTPN